MRTFRHILTRYTAFLLCVITPPLVGSSCSDNDDGVKTIAVTGISVMPQTADMVVGEIKTLAVAVVPENATDKSYTWSTSDAAVASIEGDVVTAKAVGTATLTATSKDGAFKASCAVSVTQAAVSVTGISVTPTAVSLAVGDTQTLEVTIAPANADNKSYTWSSSDTTVATIENDVITALSAGSAVITATTAEGGFTAACTVTVTGSSDAITATSAGGYYLGDQWGIGYDNDYVYFLSGNVVESDKSFDGKGIALWLDLNLPKTGATTLPAGSYTALLSDDQEQAFTWLPGTDMGAWGIAGTFVYSYADGDAEPSYIMAETGQVEITLSGSTYTVNASLMAGGTEYKFQYSGPLALADGNTGGGGGGGDENFDTIELNTLTQGEMDFYGEAYGTTGNYNNWVIYLAENTFDFDSFSGTGRMMMLELNTAKSVTREITPGTYTVIDPMEATVDAMLPFTSVPGMLSNGSPIGTWYLEDDSEGGFEVVYGATKGTVTVAKSGDIYTIDFDITDEDYEGIVRGSYTGPLSFYDGTAQSAPVMGPKARKAKGAAFKNAVNRPAKRPMFRK